MSTSSASPSLALRGSALDLATASPVVLSAPRSAALSTPRPAAPLAPASASDRQVGMVVGGLMAKLEEDAKASIDANASIGARLDGQDDVTNRLIAEVAALKLGFENYCRIQEDKNLAYESRLKEYETQMKRLEANLLTHSHLPQEVLHQRPPLARVAVARRARDDEASTRVGRQRVVWDLKPMQHQFLPFDWKPYEPGCVFM